jgi:hypothetical protein
MASEGTGAPAGYTKWEELQVPLDKKEKKKPLKIPHHHLLT